MFQPGWNLTQLILTLPKKFKGQSLIYLFLFVLVLAYGFSRPIQPTPVSATPPVHDTASAVTTTAASNRSQRVRPTGAESLFRLGWMYAIASERTGNRPAFNSAAWEHDQLGAVEPTYIPPPYKTMHEYILEGHLHFGKRVEVVTRLGALVGRDIYLVSYLDVLKGGG